jgi:alpha-N-arabinofuranosidase
VPVTADSPFGPLYWSATKDSTGTYFVKIVNYNGAASTPVTVNISGSTGDATLTTLTAPDEYSTNTLDNTASVWTESTVTNDGGAYSFTLTGNYISAVFRV